jgi:hypothetical protein
MKFTTGRMLRIQETAIKAGRPSRIGEDCIGNEGPQRTAALEEEEENVLSFMHKPPHWWRLLLLQFF